MDTVERWSFDPVELQELLREFELTGPVIPDGVDEFCRRFRLWITSHSPHDESVEAHLADLHFIQGMVNTARGNDQYAIEDLHESIDFSRGVRNPRRQILALCSVATCLEYAGMQAEASSRVLEALELAEDLDDDRTLVAVLHSLTALYQAQGAYEQMLDAALRTLAVAERLGDRPTMLRTHSAVSLAYGHLERPDEGFASLSKGFDLIDADTPPLARSYLTLNRVLLHWQSGHIAEAVVLAEQHLDLVADMPAQHAAAIYVDLAEIQLAAGNVDRAGEMLGLADGVSDPEWMKAHLLAYYRVASALHEAKNEPSVALEMLQRSTQLEHDLRGRQAKARLVALERHFAAELSAKTDEIHHLRTVELVAKNEQLSDLIHQNEEIRRVVVHDLRNPLAAVRMLSDLLLLDLADGGDADQVELVRAIQTATEEMNGSLVNLMTDREVLRDDPPMTVTAIVELCLGDLAQREEAPAVIIDASIEEVDLSVDGVLLRRAVGDVLTVVTSAARAGSVLGVDVGNTPAGVRITIVNEGRRIDELDTARDPLYVARRLIERMSGSLNVRSIEETGRTVVTIDLRS